MRLCGMTDLTQDPNPDYINTADVDYMIPGPRHPYARKVVRTKAKL